MNLLKRYMAHRLGIGISNNHNEIPIEKVDFTQSYDIFDIIFEEGTIENYVNLVVTGGHSERQSVHLGIRLYIANTTDDEMLLDRLAEDYSYDIKRAVAMNIHTSEDTLAKLSYDEDVNLRICIISNPRTNLATLKRLTKTYEFSVRKLAEKRIKEESIKGSKWANIQLQKTARIIRQEKKI